MSNKLADVSDPPMTEVRLNQVTFSILQHCNHEKYETICSSSFTLDQCLLEPGSFHTLVSKANYQQQSNSVVEQLTSQQLVSLRYR